MRDDVIDRELLLPFLAPANIAQQKVESDLRHRRNRLTNGRELHVVGDGPHTFYVRGVDGAGNTGPTVTRSWTVDTTPPDVSISSA